MAGHSLQNVETADFKYLDDFALTVSFSALGREDRDRIVMAYWQTHPRIVFFVNAPAGGALLDMGCGEGGLAYARTTYTPQRQDIRMFGCDIATGSNQNLYEKVCLGDFDKVELDLEAESIDAVLASHFFEHIENTDKYFSDMMRVMKEGASMYIEIPAPHAKVLPDAVVLREQGLPAIASNFFEDKTHIETYSPQRLRQLCEDAGFRTIASGYVSCPALEDELLGYGYKFQDQELAVYGLWSKTLWAHYIIARKPNAFDRVMPRLLDEAASR